jgi:hypothetical protein
MPKNVGTGKTRDMHILATIVPLLLAVTPALVEGDSNKHEVQR